MLRRTLVVLCAIAGVVPFAPAQPRQTLKHDRPVFLVAKPGLGDPNFAETVVLVFFPPDSGPLGVIVNRPTALTVAEAFRNDPAMREWTETIFEGGPVHGDMLAFLFRRGTPPERSLHVLGDLYLSADRGVLDDLRRQRPARPPRFFLGLAGWSSAQLDMEVASGAWYVLKEDIDAILKLDPRKMWKLLLDRVSGPVV
jgi:putative transcriptional regulator